jgi:hypothetical protein
MRRNLEIEEPQDFLYVVDYSSGEMEYIPVECDDCSEIDVFPYQDGSTLIVAT